MKGLVFFWMISMSFGFLQAQERLISGKILNANSQEVIAGVSVSIENHFLKETTDGNGGFTLKFDDLEMGNYILNISKPGFESLRLPVLLDQASLNLGVIRLIPDVIEEQSQLGTINLSENQLDDDQIDAGFSSILTAGKDAFLNAAAYDFSQTYFKPRGYDSQYGKVMINSIPLNKIQNGRP